MAVSFAIQGQWIFTTDPLYINTIVPVNLGAVTNITREKKIIDEVETFIVNFYLNTSTKTDGSTTGRQDQVEWRFTDVAIVDNFFDQFAAQISIDGISWPAPSFQNSGQWIFTSDPAHQNNLVPVNLDAVTHITREKRITGGVLYHIINFVMNTSSKGDGSTSGKISDIEWKFTDVTIVDNFFTQFAALISIDGILWTSPSPTATAWRLNGNTVNGEKWLGTIDAFDLPFRTNNIERFEIGTTNVSLRNIGSAFDVVLNNTLLTANRTFEFPDNSGTLALLSDIPVVTAGWALDGNTVVSEKWLGTIDAFDLPFRTNNVERARILASNGNFGIGITAPTNKLYVAQDSYSGIAKFDGFFGAPFNAFEIDLNGNTISYQYSRATLGISFGASGFLADFMVAPNTWTFEFGNTTIKNDLVSTLNETVFQNPLNRFYWRDSVGTKQMYLNSTALGVGGTPTSGRRLDILQNTATVSVGSLVTSTGEGGIWFNAAVPSDTNVRLNSSSGATRLNGVAGNLLFAISGVTKITMGTAGQLSTSFTTSSGVAFTSFGWTIQASNTVPASTEMIDVNWNLSATKQWSAGALATQRDFLIQPRTYTAVGASVFTTASTFTVAGSPIASTNITITRPLALWIQTGESLFGGAIAFPYRASAIATSFTAADGTIDATGAGAYTVTLETAVGCTGRIHVLKNSGAGLKTLDAAGAELIDGALTQPLLAGVSLTVQSTGTGWIII